MLKEISGIKVEVIKPEQTTKQTPVLFVHGMFAGSWMWDNYIKLFTSKGYECYALNLSGHASQPIENIGTVSVYDYIEDVKAVAESIGEFILIGHSMGGLIAMKIAEILDPKAVVSITPAPPRGYFMMGSFSQLCLILKYGLDCYLNKPLMPVKSDIMKFLMNGLSPEMQEKAYKKICPESGKAGFEIGVLQVPVDKSKISCPLLIIGAEEDESTPSKLLERIAKDYKADFFNFEGFAHLIIFEDGWEKPANEIINWIN